MGVPGYFSWIRRKYPWLVKKVKSKGSKKPVDCLYIDVNGICYQYARDEHNYHYLLKPKPVEEIIKQIIDHIDSIIETVDPQLQVYLMLDGPCPRAKMNQQRQRRFHAQTSHNTVKAALKEHGFDVKHETVPNNSIAPGTQFMFDLNASLRKYIETRIALSSQEFTQGEAGHKEHSVQYKNLQFILSDSNAPGEGEHKILEVIRKHTNYQLTHCIVGADADLLLLSLATIGKRILILRESFKFQGEKGELEEELQKLGAAIEKEESGAEGKTRREYDLVDINGLKRVILDNFKTMFTNKQIAHLKYDPMALMDDFVFLSLFAGNDFLPRQNYMQIKNEKYKENILDTLLDKYDGYLENATCYLSERGCIRFGAIIEFFRQIATIEPQFKKNNVFDTKKSAVNKTVTEYVKILSQKQIADAQKLEENDLIDLDLKVDDLKLLQKQSQHEEEDILQDLDLPAVDERKRVEKEERELEELERKQQEAGDDERDDADEEEKAEEEDQDDGKGLSRKKKNKQPYRQRKQQLDPEEEELQKMLSDEIHGKEIYLRDKLQVKDQDEYDLIIMKYLEGFQFTLLYYFRGIEKASWNYFYPHFYAPLAQDIVDFLERNPKFEIKFAHTTAFPPFKQLLGILHPENQPILPVQFHGLFDKYLKPYCPEKLNIDKYGAKMEHMQIIKLPFIDLEVLDKAYNEGNQALQATGSQYDKDRNEKSADIVFFYSKESKVEIPVFNKLVHKEDIHAAPVGILSFSHLDEVLPVLLTDLHVDMEKKNQQKQKYLDIKNQEKEKSNKDNKDQAEEADDEGDNKHKRHGKKPKRDHIDPEEVENEYHSTNKGHQGGHQDKAHHNHKHE